MSDTTRQSRSGGGGLVLGLALALSMGVFGACDGLLDVDLPDQIAEEDLEDPSQAQLLVNSAIGRYECALSEFVASHAAGNEDVFMRITGWWASFAEYQATPEGGGGCNTDDFFFGWWDALQAARGLSERNYEQISEWTAEEIVGDREQLLTMSALYAGLSYEMLGEHFCEVAVEAGPLMTPDETLAEAEEWLTTAIGHAEATGGFTLPNGIGGDAVQAAYLARARVRYARGDLAGAASDAEQVEQGFMSFATREASATRSRGNRVFNAHNQNHWGTVQGPIGGDEWLNLGAAQGWPEQQPFTGYQNLGVLPNGRAVTSEGFPITTTGSPDAVPDPRVPVVEVGEFNDWDPVYEQQKYTSLEDDIPMLNWEEAWLIRAEAAGGAEAIGFVNEIRNANGLPEVTYLGGGASAEEIERLIIEERRRSLFLEGRFWSTKIQKDLFFPRGIGLTPFNFPYGQGVRMLMPEDEYDINTNFGMDAQGSGCDPSEAPV